MATQESVGIGDLLGGRFRIDAELGRGGMATVYRASDEALGRTVAVKLFRAGITDHDETQRQRDEVQLLASLNHPGLVTLFDADMDADGGAFLVMELVEGQDLRHRLERGALEPAEAALVGRQLADALAYIHARGVIHRDVKPGNILLPDRGMDHSGPLAKLADFGIARIVDSARLTATGMIIGTAGYFSPEQALGESLSPQSDVYSLGLVLLESLTGTRAFPGSAAESMASRLNRDPEIGEGIPAPWVSVLRAMTARDPGFRPSAAEASAELGAIASAAPTRTLSPAASPVDTAELDRTEAFEPTKRYPATAATTPLGVHAPAATGTTAPTQQYGTGGHGTGETAATQTLDGGAASTRRGKVTGETRGAGFLRGRRPIVLAGATAILIAAIVTAIFFGTRPGAEDAPAPSYPAVEGELGTHLEQLQRSVEP